MPCIVDLATMREAVAELGGDPARINPLAPAEMVIDHSVIADVFGRADAFERNVELEYERNRERYQFLRWGQTAFDDFKVVPPGTGIVHQVNIEHLARVVFGARRRRLPRHLRRHRLAHHHGQRPRRPRLGRRRHRGRGGHARPARVDAHPARGRLQADRRDPGRRHRHRRRPDDHRDAAQARCGRQVRRVLRRGCRRRAAGQPRHHRQHEPRVRLDRGDLPDRRRHLRLPAPHRPQRRPGRPRRGVRQGAGPVARPGHGAGVLRVPRARPVHGGAQHRRPEAAAGPDRAHRRQDRLPGGPGRLRRRRHRQRRGRGQQGVVPGERPAGLPRAPRRPGAQRGAAPVHPAAQLQRPAEPQGRGDHGRRHADRARPRRTWRSPRSPPAPTPPTRR